MTTLKLGSRGEDVKTLQRALNLFPDGIFGKLTEEGVRQFQRSRNLTIDGIVGPETLAAIKIAGTVSKRAIKEIIIHCTATSEGRDYSVEDVRRWHIDRGFSDIGYHFLITRDGMIHKGRDLNVAGAHCLGHNASSIGICYVGGYEANSKTPKDTRTDAQKFALKSFLKDLKKIYPEVKIHSHKDFANKACPCFDATKEYAAL